VLPGWDAAAGDDSRPTVDTAPSSLAQVRRRASARAPVVPFPPPRWADRRQAKNVRESTRCSNSSTQPLS
jgi:hypothetical protein